MIFATKNRTDMINILVLIEALEQEVATECVNVYDYMNLTDSDLRKMLKEKASSLEVNI